MQPEDTDPKSSNETTPGETTPGETTPGGKRHASSGSLLMRGTAWTALAQWVRWTLSFVVLAITARFVGPEGFGLVALAGSVTALGYALVDNTLLDSLVQRKDMQPGHATAMFWATVVLGGVVALGALLLAGPAGRLLGEPQITPLVMATSPCLLLSALAAVPSALLRRSLRVDSVAHSALIGAIAGGLIGIYMALSGYGVWSLVAMQLATVTIQSGCIWFFCRWGPRGMPQWRHFHDLLHFNLNVLGVRLIEYVSYQLPRVAIGVFFGAVAVGQFAFARRFLDLLSNLVMQPIVGIVFPAFSKFAREGKPLNHPYSLGLRFTALLTYPCYLGLALVAAPTVALFFGAEWAPAVPVIQLLAIAGLKRPSDLFVVSTMRALGRPELQTYLMGLSTIVAALLMFVLKDWGLIGIALALVIRDFLLWPIGLLIVKRCFRIGILSQLKPCLVPVSAMLVMTAAVLSWQHFLAGHLGDTIGLPSAIAVGGVSYLSALCLLNRGSLREALAYVQSLRRNGVPAMKG